MVMKSERKLTSSQKWEVEGTFRTGASEASAVSNAVGNWIGTVSSLSTLF